MTGDRNASADGSRPEGEAPSQILRVFAWTFLAALFALLAIAAIH